MRAYLSGDLWTENEAYDAGHGLMVPLHAAFELGVTEWMDDFDAYAARFAASSPQSRAQDRLNKLHHAVLLSRYVVLSARAKRLDRVPAPVLDYLYELSTSMWSKEPAWQWDTQAFAGGMKERLAWKLSHDSSSPSYLHALLDEDCFLFAVASDLRTYERLSGVVRAESPEIDEIVTSAATAFQQESSLESGRWLLQPGVWWDHPEYAYAGCTAKSAGMKPVPVKDISWDTSHSLRFALFLHVYREAFLPGSTEYAFYDKAISGLERQFFEVALIPPSSAFPAHRTTTYLDGVNGVYRWETGYPKGLDGYGPYETSGSLTLGWWSFLRTGRSRSLYQALNAQFPFPSNVITTYVGPNTTRPRNPLVALPNRLVNGYDAFVCHLASRLPLE